MYNVNEEINKYGYFAKKEASTSSIKNKIECYDIEGYRYLSSIDNIRQNVLSKFHKSNPFTIYNIKLWLKSNFCELELLSTDFQGSGSKLLFKYKDGNYLVESSWNNISTGFKPSIFSKFNRYSLYNINLYFKNNNLDFEVLDEEFLGADKKMTFRDKEGYYYSYVLNNILKDNGHNIVHTGNEYSIRNIQLFIDKLGLKLTVLSEEYKGKDCNIKLYCPKHGEFETTWDTINKSSKSEVPTICRKCNFDNRKGEKNSNWNGGITEINDYLRKIIDSWKTDSFKLFDYKCSITKDKKDCIIHHLYSFSNIVKEIHELNNIDVKKCICDYTEQELDVLKDECLKLHYKYGLGVCLTKEIHKEFHKMYGYGNNTPEQFYEFYKTKTGINFLEDYPLLLQGVRDKLTSFCCMQN